MKTKKTNQNSEKKPNKNTGSNLIAIIRISGMVKVKKDIVGTLNRLKLRRKYSCVLIDSNNKGLMGMLEKSKYHIAYGTINKDILIKLIKERGKNIKGDKKELKLEAEKIAEELFRGKKLNEFGLKSFFRLHPPRKGIDSKKSYPKGVLGNNKEDINKLIERML